VPYVVHRDRLIVLVACVALAVVELGRAQPAAAAEAEVIGVALVKERIVGRSVGAVVVEVFLRGVGEGAVHRAVGPGRLVARVYIAIEVHVRDRVRHGLAVG